MGFQIHLKTAIALLVLALPCAGYAGNQSSTQSSGVEEGPRCNLEAWAKNALDPAKGEVGYRIFGKEYGPVLVLIHGMGGDGGGWQDVIQAFGSKYKILVYQQRGHGISSGRGEDYSTTTLAADLKRLTDHLGLKKFSIIGHSMGARVAARFTALYPDQVDRLIIEDMDLISRSSDDPEHLRRAILKAREVASRSANGFATREEMANALYPFFTSSDFEFVMAYAVRNPEGRWVSGASLSPSNYILYWNQANTDRDLLQGLARADRPTLMLRADVRSNWSAMTNEGVHKARQIFPKAVILQVNGADHNIHNSQPTSYLQIINEFLKQRKF